ncbi:fumarate reductase flavoC-term family protein [Mycobacterium xenopi 4042]|uniref:L-aspartate oxidase n=1 Tax=Mycobacterium xenopi 4042 TaxID=1299334 RepID=X7YQN2_MYCXE|nr:fumarate reductase flavoC-term family protein [Mycobacterium xenopi 4042]
MSVLNPDGLGVVHAPSVILATGGLGHLYGVTTNPDGSTGDGVALALRAGVAVSDLEFIQFHPTMLFGGLAGGRRPLVTEAIRGEGATLVDAQGVSVMAGVHPMGDLAPRDVVAAAIDARLKATGDPCVYLDARGIADFESRFPTVTAACQAVGVDPVRQPIPVVPGAHYSCGGVVTDVCGRTELPGLFAAGEVARTGMHGANRLASNSLLEGLVVGGRAGRAAAAHAAAVGPSYAKPIELTSYSAVERRELQRAMTRDASVVRDAVGLQRLLDTLSAATGRPVENRADVEDAALTLTARAVAAAALARDESRGCHTRPTTRTPHPNRRKAVWFGWPTTRSACTSRLWRRCADDCGGIVGLRPGRSSRRDTTRPGRGFTLRTGCDHVGNRAGRSGDDRVAGDPGTGVIAGVDIALLVLEEVLDGEYRVLDRVDDGARLQPALRCWCSRRRPAVC